jgi:hypothetical protein
MNNRIMYVCSDCADDAPDACGHFDPAELRVMPDGRWLCDGCYDDERNSDMPPFDSLPPPPIYLPSSST